MTYGYYRPRLGKARYGEPVAWFSTPWPAMARRLYLVSEFTAMFPGRVELKRRGERGFAELQLWEGIYHYVLVDELYNVYDDYDNSAKEPVDFMNSKVVSSLADIGVNELKEASNEGGLHPHLIVHDESRPSFVTGYDGLSLVRLFSVRGEISEVVVEYRSPEGSWREAVADLAHRDPLRDYFEAVIPEPISAYRFALTADGRKIPFGFDGVGSKEPWIVDPRMFTKRPPWYVGTSYYLIFPDSFAGAKAVSGSRPRLRLGGNLKAAAEALDHIKRLGVEAVYLTPIYEAASYHGYDVIDHKRVSEKLGGWDAYRVFLTRAHELGIRVVLDIVAHHTSPCAREFLEAIRGGPASNYWTWYRFLVNDLNKVPKDVMELFTRYIDGGCGPAPEELRQHKPFYEGFYRLWSMPKLNYDSKEVLDHMCDIIRFWLTSGADGIRVDVAHGLPDAIMRGLYECAKSQKPDAVVIMELMAPLAAYKLGEEADSAMNYEAWGHILRFLKGLEDAAELAATLNKQFLALPLPVANSLYNLIGSHDTRRVMSELGSSELVAKAFAIEFAMYGSPSVYYGDEVGMEGGKDPDNRLPMIWDRDLWHERLLRAVVELAQARKELRELKHGLFRAWALSDETLVIRRFLPGSSTLVIVPRGSATVKLPAGCRPHLMWDSSIEGDRADINGFAIILCPEANLLALDTLKGKQAA